jgi:hypothetical protein
MNRSDFAWIPETAIADWVVSSAWVWPMLESIHFVSLCVLFGSLLVVDLRLIGFFRAPCASTVGTLALLAFAAFGVNLATGVLFFFGNTFKYVDNPAFELKLVLILIAGLNAAYYKLRLSRLMDTDAVSRASIAVGWLSLLLWAGVIVCGRMITFYAPLG